MKEILPYFGHDNNALEHPKFQALIATHGFAGYGRFWALNERVAASEQARLDLSKKVNRAGLAVRLQLTLIDLETFLTFLADVEECGLIHYQDGIVTTDRTTENLRQLLDVREAAKARKEAKKAGSANSSGSSANSGEGSANSALKERKDKGKERKDKEEEFDGTGETPPDETPPENQPTQDDFDPRPDPTPDTIPTHNLKPPKGLTERFTNDDLDEVRQRFGTRAQEALEIIALKLDAGDYKRFTRPWGQVKTWLAKETSALSWLDKATGKGTATAPAARPVDTRGLNEPPVPEDERVDLGGFSPEDFLRRADDDFEPRAEGVG